jgi:hypothetical protein
MWFGLAGLLVAAAGTIQQKARRSRVIEQKVTRLEEYF